MKSELELGHGFSMLECGEYDHRNWGCRCGAKGYGSTNWRLHLLDNGIELVMKRTKYAKNWMKSKQESTS